MFKRLSHFAPRTIRAKLILAAVVCILVPAAFTLNVYHALTQKAVKQQAIANAENSLELVNGSVTHLLKGMLDIANYIQVNAGLNTYFKLVASGYKEPDPYRKFTDANRVLEQLDSLTVVGEKSYVTVLLTDGSYFMNYSVSDYNPLDLLQEPWFEQLDELQGLDSYWIGAEPTQFKYDRFDHPYQVSVARTLRLANSDIYGYVVVTVMEDQVSDIFSELTAGQEVRLVDAAGRIVADRNKDNIGGAYPGGKQEQLGHGLGAGHEYEYEHGRAAAETAFILRDDGKPLLVAEQSIALNGWRLILTQPYQEATVNISSIFNRVFLFQIISFIVFMAMLIVLVRTFTRPLVRLGKAASAVQRGNLEVRSGVRGNDEIGRLGLLFDQMLDRVKQMIAEISTTQARKRTAELKMLQAQINPHFLFNVLNSIRMKVMKHGDLESGKMIGSLSTLLRMTISREEDEITLHEEIELVSHYVRLMNLRQKQEVTLELAVAPEAFLVKVPRLILQPLVENALIHGLTQQAGVIRIAASMEQDGLLLTVADNGAGMEEAKLEATLRRMNDTEAAAERAGLKQKGHFSGMGLHNVMERMRLRFGPLFHVEIRSEPGLETVIEMYIPHNKGER
ncbi:sensor histidine kinase [Paenibacillus macerans]|uniref:cache domain-containing sensor histidine kinase n=1 Tax=Paenibacillus macerans TaxID=44252 RepID=UPI000EE5324D|nr:sensor histidine kinase [Paenibacillus macerans]GBK62010.1 sensor histidine kinase [Paenibacillus macerans]GBK68318.1 sensor histidine kinase [Paenibacillus macerans]